MKYLYLLVSLLFCTASVSAQDLSQEKVIMYDDFGLEDYAVMGCKWNKTALNYYIESTTSDISSQDCINAIANSFAAWSDISDFIFNQVNDSSNADLTIKWDYNFNSNSILAETGTAYNASTYIISKATIHFNGNVSWATNGSNYDVFKVAVHEIGHALGMRHSEYSNAIMYYAYNSTSSLTADDICGLWSIYDCPFPISGPSTVGSSAVYFINHVPVDSRVSVVWSLSDTYFNDNCLDQDVPSANQCTILGSSDHAMNNGMLTANLYYNSNLLQTFTKSGINAPVVIFPGTYFNGQATKPILIPEPLYVLPGTSVIIQSPKLNGATVSYSGGNVSPTFWTLNDYNILVVGMPSSLNSVVVMHVDCSDGTSYNLPIITTNSVSLMSVSLNGGILEVEVTPNHALSEIDGYNFTSLPEVSTWSLEIRNALTGAKAYNQQVDGSYCEIDTSCLSKGVYVIRVIVGNEVLSEKIVIK